MNIFKKGDIILLLVIATIVGASFVALSIYRNGDATDKIAVIKLKDKIIREINLDEVTEPQTVELQGEHVQLVRIENGRIRFIEASCPDQTCVDTGWLSQKGDVAVCIPNGSMIKIYGEAQNVDTVTH